jgi:hypothetical protein
MTSNGRLDYGVAACRVVAYGLHVDNAFDATANLEV